MVKKTPKQLTKMYYDCKELTRKERDIIGVGDIRLNQAKCKLCGDVIRSKHRHDFVTCKCGEIFVDGGSWYSRRGANDLNNIEEMCVCYKDVEQESIGDYSKKSITKVDKLLKKVSRSKNDKS